MRGVIVTLGAFLHVVAVMLSHAHVPRYELNFPHRFEPLPEIEESVIFPPSGSTTQAIATPRTRLTTRTKVWWFL